MIKTGRYNKYKREDADKRISKFIRNAIPREIMLQAAKSKFNLEKVLMRLVFDRENTWFYREETVAWICGVVGNVIANRYFASQGYEVKNEVPIFDKDHKKVSASDIVLTLHRPYRVTFIELKTSKTIILDEKDYPIEDEEFGFGDYIPSDYIEFDRDRMLPRLSVKCGRKAIEQLRKANEHINLNVEPGAGKAKLCVFQGSFLSDEFMSELSKEGELITIPYDIEKVINYSSLLVEKIMTEGRELLDPTKGREREPIEIPDFEL